MPTQLWTFLGMSDRNAARAGASPDDPGPLARALADPALGCESVHLIDDRPASGELEASVAHVRRHLLAKARSLPAIVVHETWPRGGSPSDVAAVATAVREALSRVELAAGVTRVYNLSSGTSAMTLVLALLATGTKFPGRCCFVDRRAGIEWVEWPEALLRGI